MCVTDRMHMSVPLSVCLVVLQNSTHLLLYGKRCVYVLLFVRVRLFELVAKNYCTFVAFVAAAAVGCLAGFLLLVVSIYGKLLKLYGNLFATECVCVCAVYLASLRAFSVVIVLPLSAGFLFFYLLDMNVCKYIHTLCPLYLSVSVCACVCAQDFTFCVCHFVYK